MRKQQTTNKKETRNALCMKMKFGSVTDSTVTLVIAKIKDKENINE